MDIYQSAPYLNFYSRLAVDLDLDAYKFIYTSGVGNKLKVWGGVYLLFQKNSYLPKFFSLQNHEFTNPWRVGGRG